MANFKQKPNNGDPLIDESLYQSSNNYRIDTVDYKYYVYLINGNGVYLGLTTDSIELLNIRDNILEIAASGTCVIRNDNDSIERSNIGDILTKENYFERQPKNNSSYIDEFFFRNDCRDYLFIYIKPDLTQGLGSNIQSTPTTDAASTLLYTFSIIKNEDLYTSPDSAIKFKQLTLIDNDLEILREKNLFFSSATLLPHSTAEQLAHLDDDDRGAYTGDIIQQLLIQGLNSNGSDNTSPNDRQIIDTSLFNQGSSTLFYSSPGEYNVLDDISYVTSRHTSAVAPFDPCILRKDRYSQFYTFISYKDYFNNAIFQNKNVSAGGALHLETILLGSEIATTTTPTNNKTRIPTSIYNNMTFGEFSLVDNFKFYNMNGIDAQSHLVSTAVHSYQLSDKQFQIDLSNNSISNTMDTYYNHFVKGDKEYPLFVASDNIFTNIFINQVRKNNLNFKNVFSINDTEPDQRLGYGRNDVLKNAIFLNNAISLDLKGLTFRSAGKFFSFGRKEGFLDSKFDDKVLGTYFAVQVDHNFSKGKYTNNIIGVKTYLYGNPHIKEVI